jgi:hypothetical protein
MDSEDYIEFDLSDVQSLDIPAPQGDQAIIVGSIQRRTYPGDRAGTPYFRGRWVTGKQAEHIRKAARKVSPKRKTKPTKTT